MISHHSNCRWAGLCRKNVLTDVAVVVKAEILMLLRSTSAWVRRSGFHFKLRQECLTPWWNHSLVLFYVVVFKLLLKSEYCTFISALICFKTMEARPKISKEKLQFVLWSGELFKNKVTILHTKSKMKLLQFFYFIFYHTSVLYHTCY